MRVLFDLLHPADVNLFKNTVFRLKEEGHTVYLTYRQRGVLERIARSEFPGMELVKLGTHRKGTFNKIMGMISREFEAFRFLRKNKIDLVVCQGLACAFASKLSGTRILHYDDDSEYKLTYYMGKIFSDIDIVPFFMPVEGRNLFKYKGYKELAYLHPSYFSPDPSALPSFGINENEYVFIREISNVSVNYQKESGILPEIVEALHARNLKIVLSIENKQQLDLYKDKCIILEEPVRDLYSLIRYSRFVISSGDTMAREACVLGKACIYTGGRMMLANDQFIRMGAMFKEEDPGKIRELMDKLLSTTLTFNIRQGMEKLIREEFEDTNEVILLQINKLKR